MNAIPGTPRASRPLRGRAGRRAAAALALSLLFLCVPALAAPTDGAKTPEWPDEVVDAMSRVPVQSEGRIKPLHTWAAHTLLNLTHKRSVEDPWERKLGPVAWMLEVMLRPEAARRLRCFRIVDDQILQAIRVEIPDRKKADRYSYDELEPGFGRLAELASTYAKMDGKERSLVETGVVELHHDVQVFEALLHYLDWARIQIPVTGPLASAFPDREGVSLLELMAEPEALDAFVVEVRRRFEAGEEPGELEASLRSLSRVLATDRFLSIVPPVGSVDDQPEWATPTAVAAAAVLGGQPVPAEQREILSALSSLAQAADPAAWRQAAVELETTTRGLAEARGEYDKVELEVKYHRFNPFTKALVVYLLAFVLVALTWLFPAIGWLPMAAWGTTLVAWGIHVAGIVMRCMLLGRPPISTLYETVIFITGGCVLFFLVTELINRKRIALALGPVLGAIGLFVANRYEVMKGEDTFQELQAVLNTNFWLATHVTCISIGYCGGLVTSAIAHVYVIGKMTGRGSPTFYREVARMNYGALCFALLFSVVGTILGGVWANDSWGRFWGWDPKENGALMIVLSQLAILHARMGGMIKAFGIAMASIAGGIIVAFSWWGVNLLGIGLHSYGFTSGVARNLNLFYVVEGVVLLAGAAWYLVNRMQRRARAT